MQFQCGEGSDIYRLSYVMEVTIMCKRSADRENPVSRPTSLVDVGRQPRYILDALAIRTDHSATDKIYDVVRTGEC
jgi:hypothetical protein